MEPSGFCPTRPMISRFESYWPVIPGRARQSDVSDLRQLYICGTREPPSSAAANPESITPVCVHGFRVPSLRSGPGMTRLRLCGLVLTGRRGMVLVPVARDVEPPAHPYVLVLGDVIEEAGEAGRARRMTGDA